MATSNDQSVLSSNGSARRAPKRKVSRKSSETMANSIISAPKRVVSRRPAIVEILFTTEANPFREPIPPYVWIDYPTESEILRAPAYAIRLGVGGADLVEISINKGAWLPCRLTSGYWWYDWTLKSPGKQTLVVRMRATDGRWFKTPTRTCQYRP